MSKHYLTTIFAFSLFLALARGAAAASIYLLPERGAVNRGEEFTIDVKIDSEGEDINAAQATISWPSGVLEFVGVNKNGSVFNFWVEEPKLSSSSDAVSFIGGTANGVSGEALQVLKIKFRGAAAGAADISVTDAAVTAADGVGTNVLSQIRGAIYRVGAETARPEAPAPPREMPQPVPVERKAVPAAKLPQKPNISVPLYPDQEKWHNHFGETVALWDVPDDVVKIAVSVDQSPNTEPKSVETELFTGKKLGVLEEGIWYIHAQFRNNVGWGPVAHYRVAIDAAPPLEFEITVSEGETTDNPAPVLRFETSDALSGLSEYQVKIDGTEPIKIAAKDFDGSFTLPLQAPGARRIVVRAWDLAENSVADSIDLEILPIPSPAITFVTTELFSDEERGLTVKGTALPGLDVLLQVWRLLDGEKGEVVAKSAVSADEKGTWEATFDEPLRDGRYVVAVRSRDARGALSLTAESPEVRVKVKPIIQIGFIQLGKGGAALLLLAVLVAGFGGGAWFYRKRQEKLALRVSFAAVEIAKIFQLLKSDLDRLRSALKTPTAGDDEYTLKRLEENLQKMEIYLKKGVEKIKK